MVSVWTTALSCVPMASPRSFSSTTVSGVISASVVERSEDPVPTRLDPDELCLGSGVLDDTGIRPGSDFSGFRLTERSRVDRMWVGSCSRCSCSFRDGWLSGTWGRVAVFFRGERSVGMNSDARVFVHPQGLCDSDEVGDGTRVWAFAHILPGARVGRDCNVCDGAYIEGGAVVGDRVTIKNQVMIFEGVEIADDVFLGPGVAFTNDLTPRAHIKRHGDALLPTTVERGATLGARVTVVCGLTIGENAFVGAGAVVVRDVTPHAFVVGNPGRQIGWACECGERLPDDLVGSCGRAYELVDGRLRPLSA